MTSHTDLTERLKHEAELMTAYDAWEMPAPPPSESIDYARTAALMREAAQAIEELRQELRTAREALKPYAKLADKFHPATRGDQAGVMTDLFHQGDLEHFTINDFRRARAALSKPKPYDGTRGRE